MHLRTTTSPGEALGIVVLCFGWFILGSAYAVSDGFRSGAFSESGSLGLVGVELILGTMAAYVLRARGFDVASLYPRPSAVGLATGALLYVAAAGAAWVAVMPLDPGYYSEPYERLMGGPPIGLPVLVLLGIVNGAYEEIFLLGFLLRGLRGHGLWVAIGVALLVRVLYHLYQGPYGAIYVGTFGLVLSLYYAATGKLFPVVLAHACADIVPFLWQ
jgi:membrane protease YdiL (CAAX protease family)